MAEITTADNNFQHFSASAGDTVFFSRPTSNLILSTAVATVTVSFDGKAGSFTLQAGVHHFPACKITSIVFGGAGAVSGAGMCV